MSYFIIETKEFLYFRLILERRIYEDYYYYRNQFDNCENRQILSQFSGPIYFQPLTFEVRLLLGFQNCLYIFQTILEISNFNNLFSSLLSNLVQSKIYERCKNKKKKLIFQKKHDIDNICFINSDEQDYLFICMYHDTKAFTFNDTAISSSIIMTYKLAVQQKIIFYMPFIVLAQYFYILYIECT